MIPNQGYVGICDVCKCEALMTRDHVIPKWLIVDVARFGIDWKAIVEKGDLSGKLYRKVCGACNLAKGGTINYKDPTIKAFMRTFILEIYGMIGPTETGPRKLKVICGCARNEPCAVVPGVIDSGIAKPSKFKHEHCKGTCWCGYSVPIVSTGSPLPIPLAHAA